MKIVTKNSIKYKGSFIEPGTDLNVAKDAGEYLIAEGAAEAAGEKPKSEPTPEPEPETETENDDGNDDAGDGDLQDPGDINNPIVE